MYEMWQAHVNVLIWFGAQDPENASDATVEFVGGSGLYAADGRPKLMLRAFTFPFIASVTRGRGFAWGQIAGAGRRRVTIQRHRGHGWVRVMQVTTRPGGVFTARFRARVQGVYRASARGYQPSLPYNSTPIKPGRTHAGFPH
jgi:hypothetical protein